MTGGMGSQAQLNQALRRSPLDPRGAAPPRPGTLDALLFALRVSLEKDGVMRSVVLSLLTLCAVSMAAQTTIGSQLSDAGVPISVTTASTLSYVELAHPARTAGTVNEVSFS